MKRKISVVKTKLVIYALINLIILYSFTPLSQTKVFALSGLNGEWKLNETSGQTVSDSSGNGYQGTASGGFTWTSGKKGNCISLNGINGYVNINDASNLDGMSALTVSAWVNIAQMPSQPFIPVGKDSNNTSYRLVIQTNGKVHFAVRTVNNGWYTTGTTVTCNTALSVNNWYHIAGVYNGSAVKIYINGTLEATGSPVLSGNIYDSPSPVRLGYKSGSTVDYYKGKIDEVDIYNTCLSDTQINALYNNIYKYEAENMSLQNYTLQTIQNASNGQVIQASSQSSTASVAFTGISGYYSINACYYENAGVYNSSFSVKQNGEALDEWIGQYDDTDFHTRVIKNYWHVTNGDVFEFTGSQGTDPSILDYIQFCSPVQTVAPQSSYLIDEDYSMNSPIGWDFSSDESNVVYTYEDYPTTVRKYNDASTTQQIKATRNFLEQNSGKLTLEQVFKINSSKVNLAYGAAVSVSGFDHTMDNGKYIYDPQYVIDGKQNISLYTPGWASDTTRPAWVQLTWPQTVTFNKILLYFCNANPSTSLLTDYQVQYWDGSQWCIFPDGNVTGNPQSIRAHISSTGISTNMIRIYSNQANYVRINELEVYNTNADMKTDGISWELKDSQNTGIKLYTYAGNLCYQNSSGDPVTIVNNYTANKWYAIRVAADLDTHTANITVSDRAFDSNDDGTGNQYSVTDIPFLNAVTKLNNFYIQTPPNAYSALFTSKTELYKGYIANENFLTTSIGTMPPDWNVQMTGGKIDVRQQKSQEYNWNSAKLLDVNDTASVNMSKSIPAQTQTFTSDFSFMVADKYSWSFNSSTQNWSSLDSWVTLSASNGKLTATATPSAPGNKRLRSPNLKDIYSYDSLELNVQTDNSSIDQIQLYFYNSSGTMLKYNSTQIPIVKTVPVITDLNAHTYTVSFADVRSIADVNYSANQIAYFVLLFRGTTQSVTNHIYIDYVKLTKQKAEFNAIIKSGSTVAGKFVISGNNLSYEDANAVLHTIWSNYKPNLWYNIRFVVNVAFHTMDIYVNQVKKATAIAFISPVNSIDTLVFSTINGTHGEIWIDDIKMFSGIYDSSDVPEPESVTVTQPYTIGTQACDLWSYGHQMGYDTIFEYDNRTPFLGYYDDGNPEVADWMAKYMLDHGISLYHTCWYRPAGTEGNALKTPSQSRALEEGFMNCKYFDRIKFSILYCNIAVGVSDSDDFIDNILNYWIEHYFKNPSYYLIDNKPVISIINPTGLNSQTGGSSQLFDIVNQKLTAEGFSGAIFMSRVLTSVTQSDMNAIKNEGYQYVYDYALGSDSLSQQQDFLTTQRQLAQNAGLELIPIASQGWGPETYSGKSVDRKINLSPSDWNSLLIWLRDVFMPAYPQNSLARKLVLLDNWNELGEGHFIQPTNLKGFAYLDGVRQVFVSPNPQHADIIPTKRFDWMVPKLWGT